MRVFLDASAAAKASRTGVGHYVARLAEALLRADPALRLTLGVRLGRFSRRAHVYVPPEADRARAPRRWFASFAPGLASAGHDVVHGPDARVVGGRGRQVVTVHDLFSLKSTRWADAGFRARKHARYAELARRADVILTPSRASAHDVTALLGVPADRVRVTPLGVDPSFSPIGPAARAPVLARLGVHPPYLLFVGLAQPRKNLEAVTEVFRRLSARRDDLRLVLAGPDGYPPGRLDQLVRATAADARVHLLGYVPATDLPALYAGATALLFPSHDEGFGLPALEAMACGCPAVVSTAGALPEVVGDDGLLAAPDAHDALEAHVARMLFDPEARRLEVARGLARAAAFTWDATARATLSAYADGTPRAASTQTASRT